MKNRKNVGILTFHYSVNNFGAVIQSLAVSRLIESFGFNPIIINYRPKILGFFPNLIYFINYILGYNFQKFRSIHLKCLTNKIKSDEDFIKLNSSIDVFTVGSDQVWRYRNDYSVLSKYYLDFVSLEKKKIAIAVSFGKDIWDGPLTHVNKLKKLVKEFDFISVREESGIRIVEELFDSKATRILDPTLLVDKSIYYNLIKSSNLDINVPFLSFMLLDYNYESELNVKSFAKKNFLQFIHIKGFRLAKNPDFWIYNRIEDWLNYLSKSSLVITDSFHCVVFCLIFKVPFICLINDNRGNSRLFNLLGICKLEHRVVSSLDLKTIDKIYTEKIDYDSVWHSLDVEISKSKTLLSENLSL